MKEAEQLREWLWQYKHNIFLGGAGVSTASGIPDFRSAHGLYMEKKRGVSYEEMLSHDYYVEHTEEFYDFMRQLMLYPDAKPNAAHYALAKLEREGRLEAVITQNIDGLHQAAGSKVVLELHGSVMRNYCEQCGAFHDVESILHAEGVPRCTCGGSIKPDVVLYEEGLDQKTLTDAVRYISNADVLIVGGTSLAVYPAAGLLDYYRGNKLVLVNKTPTPRDSIADLVVQGSIGEIFSQL